ncbi:MAG: hypothetical protein JSS99_07075 [Actinobacteria bacterium]|nr:hypothetical protein [Actinomycetota bacterium]
MAPAAATAANPATLAVIGDIPYGTTLINEFPSDVAEINADPSVGRVIHLGDIKNGSTRCDTSYFEQIRSDFDGFVDPLVYTPGDNEWTDCHRASNGGYVPAGPTPAGQEPSRLDTIRRIFFGRPGFTLGQNFAPVRSQGPSTPENVMWKQADTIFATLNVPGSNNDFLPWFDAAETPAQRAAQQDEVAGRTAADVDWIDEAFDAATREQAAAVVIGIQADMWDPAIIAAGPSQYSAFTPVVQELARKAAKFGKPVLLLNGDSHLYESDRPLTDPHATQSLMYGVVQPVPNLVRVTVQGSTNVPHEWLRLYVDPRSPDVFSWENVVF